MTQSASTATVITLITAAVAAYGDADGPQLGSQWTAVDATKDNPDLVTVMADAGYSGQAYVNLQTGEVVIADRGTIDIEQNAVSDAEIALTLPLGTQAVANTFAAAAVTVAQSQLEQV